MSLSTESQRPIVSDYTLALMVYLLYGAGYFTGFSALVGVIVAQPRMARGPKSAPLEGNREQSLRLWTR